MKHFRLIGCVVPRVKFVTYASDLGVECGNPSLWNFSHRRSEERCDVRTREAHQ